MLHIIGWILLGILKLIGIILGLLLVLILAILFVPIRYKVNGKADGDIDSIKASGYVSWLMHGFHMSFSYTSDGMQILIRLIGIKVHPRKKNNRKEEEPKSETPPKVEQQMPNTDAAVQTKPLVLSEKEEKKSTHVVNLDKEKQDIKREKQEKTKDIEQERHRVKPREEKKEKENGKPTKKEKREKETPQNKKDEKKRDEVKEKSPSAFDQIKAFYNELHKPENEGVLQFVWKYIKRLIIWIFPRRMNLILDIGLEDEVVTGYITAVGAIGYGVTKGHVVVVPHFGEQIIAGKLQVKSHLFLYQPLYYIMRLIIDKRVRRIIAFIRK